MRAVLVKRRTDDGLMSANNDVPLGRAYEVISGTERVMSCYHVPTDTIHEKVMIRASDGSWLPVELLRIEAPA